MSYRRFFALGAENSVFKFTIDTRNIVSGATNGSQNPLTFSLPINTTIRTFIVQVSDGRPDYTFDGNNIITFAAPGIYTITLIGRVYGWTFGRNTGYDKLKIISIDHWGSEVIFGLDTNGGVNVFKDCQNLIINADNGLKFRYNSAEFFVNIRGFAPHVDLLKYDISGCLNLPAVTGIYLPLYRVFSPFVNVSTTMLNFYRDVDLSNVSKVEIISNTVANIQGLLWNSGFQGELKITAPITSMGRLLSGVVNPPSVGHVDIRRVTTNAYFIDNVMSTPNVDATLLGWASLDWAGFTSTAPAFDFYNSKYSNNSAVIAAKIFLESKNVKFNRLTMA